MENLLNNLEWLARYGFIDIIFGIGVIGFIVRLLRKNFPSNYENLHVDVSNSGPVTIPGAKVGHSLIISLRNSGLTNFYIARAYFRPKLRRWWCLWLKRIPTKLRVHPNSDRISSKDAIELKFQGRLQSIFNEYETLVRPGHDEVQSTWLPLMQPVQQEEIENRQCGVLYIEYATKDKQGIHRERI